MCCSAWINDIRLIIYSHDLDGYTADFWQSNIIVVSELVYFWSINTGVRINNVGQT